jgi:hypothetical protein
LAYVKTALAIAWGTIAKGHGSEWIGAELAKIIALEKLLVG